jgi:hypothetical protein
MKRIFKQIVQRNELRKAAHLANKIGFTDAGWIGLVPC